MMKWLIVYVGLILVFNARADFSEKCSKFNYLTMKTNHYSYSNMETFKLRYIMNTDNWKPNKPIFFYCGNEADIEVFCNEMGFLWESSVDFQAMVVFAEHRYYGESIPYGDKTFEKMENLEYLTPEQALSDFAFLVEHIKNNIKGALNSEIIAFGGSYGGMLAYMMRVKYPHLITGALASSAPLLLSEVPCNTHFDYVTKLFNRYGENCSKAIRKSWSIINNLYASQNGRDQIANIFHLDDANLTLDEFKEFLKFSYQLIAMSNYPYPTDMFQKLPTWPVKEVCERITKNLNMNDDINVLKQVYNGLDLFYNYTGDKTSLSVGPPDNIPINDDTAFQYQLCTSIYFPFCTNGKTDMFEAKEWSSEEYSEKCFKRFGIKPNYDWFQVEYGPRNINAFTNIIFTNGELDIWIVSGILKVNSDSLTSIIIKDAAHHLELWTSNKDDPRSVIEAREEIKKIFSKWLNLEDIHNNSLSIKSATIWYLTWFYCIFRFFRFL